MVQPKSIVNNSHGWLVKSPATNFGFVRGICTSASTSTSTSSRRRRMTSPFAVSSSLSPTSLRYAVLGAGFAGLSVTYHLLQQCSRDTHVCIDIFDEVGIGGGASGVSGGLLHPYSPKAKLLWRGEECWKESLNLLNIAESAVASRDPISENGEIDQRFDGFIARRRGLLRPAMDMKNLNVLNENAETCLASCRIQSIDLDTVKHLVPNLHVPLNSAFYMPDAVNIHPRRYLQALFLACENLVKLSCGGKELHLHKKSVETLLDLAGEYDSVIICLGARADMIPELSGRLPLRTCRGVIAQLQLPDNIGEEYPDHSPSILSNAWLAVQGRRNIHMGSTWDWKSTNYSPDVSDDEASKALEELLPKASAFYPGIKNWTFSVARAGLRAMPPLTPSGSFPLLGCVDDFVGGKHTCKFWLMGGLGSRGLLYHGWLGKLLAQAVLSCNEDLIPPELISWRKIKP